MNASRASFAVVLVLVGCGGSPAANPQFATSNPAPTASLTQAEAPAPPSDPPRAKAAGLPRGIPGTSIEFLGGDGSSQKQAVLIHGAKGENDGVAAEYKYLELLYGAEGERWNRSEQSLLEDNGRSYDELDYTLDGKRVSIYFDITEYFGKF